MILAGDLGGTKTVLGEFELSDEGLKLVRQHVYASRSYSTFDEILSEFLDGREGPPFRAACFGFAGIVVDGRSHATNLPWTLDERALSGRINVPRVKLLNDLEATAFGMLALPDSLLAILNPGDHKSKGVRSGNIGVIAAGTGLGEAMLYWDGEHYHPVASEGGHADFAPRNAREIDLWNYLARTYGGHVSYERVLSGPGIVNIYHFLKEAGFATEPDGFADELKSGDPATVITQHGLSGDLPLCTETIAMFCSSYAAEAGNVALRCVATGGVFLGGGIAPKLLPALRTPSFLESFRAKGRFAGFLNEIEIAVALDTRTALLGAAKFAERL